MATAKKKRNPSDLTKRNNDARKKKEAWLTDQIRLIWKTIAGMKLDIDGAYSRIELAKRSKK